MSLQCYDIYRKILDVNLEDAWTYE